MSIIDDLLSHKIRKGMRTRVENVIDRAGVTEWEQLGAIDPRRLRMIKGCGITVLVEIAKLVDTHCDVTHPGWSRRWDLKAVTIAVDEQVAVFNAVDTYLENFKMAVAERGVLLDIRERLRKAVDNGD